MHQESYVCDACGADLKSTTNAIGYRLALVVEGRTSRPNDQGFLSDMNVYPPLERSYHFCGTACLVKWVHDTWPARVVE